MKIEKTIEPDEIDSPIRFATAVIECCMDVTCFNPTRLKENYNYLYEVNEHIDTFLRNFNYNVNEEDNNEIQQYLVR